jgi:hypothetical protein
MNNDIREYSLEEHLENLCKNNEKYKHLYAAWTTDKDIYKNSLSAVPINFPHYSRHESSHSLSIINKIEMLLGIERIKTLSPTDTFLILESAFSHDLGMIIPEELLKEEWKKPSFKRFLKKLSSESFDEDIMRSAQYLLNIQEENIEFNEENIDWPIEVRNSVTLIIAEAFRKNHGLRSELLLRNSEKISVNINSNKFIPIRIMNIVGKIATAHGENFMDILKNLQYVQNGIGVDKIHPRFIACLIRLGDLLDLDNGRFNEVFEKTSPYPCSSRIHKEKHSSITHFLVSPEKIEVSAICNDDNVYRETRLWFDLLRDELKNLSSKWSDIVPNGFSGGPPSLGEIKLSIEGADNITEQLDLRFNIDPIRAFEMIEGSGIYRNSLVFIREMLQNAIDATKIKIWEDIKEGKYDDVSEILNMNFNGEKVSNYNFNFPCVLPDNIRKFYPIDIELTYKDNQYIFIIKDKGRGISLNDLKRMENVGGSWEQDEELQNFIDSMPGWMQPTGSFGIGIHSVFLVTDEIEIETKSEEEGGYTVNFISRRKNGYITVKNNKEINRIGTKIIVRMKENKLYEIYLKDHPLFRNYDFIDPNYQKKLIIEMLQDEIDSVSRNIHSLNIRKIKDNNKIWESNLQEKDDSEEIYIGKTGLNYRIYFRKCEERNRNNNKTSLVNKWFIEVIDKEHESIIKIMGNNRKFNMYNPDAFKILFKEIKCNNSLIRDDFYELFDVEIDILKGRAKEILHISRDILKNEILDQYIKLIYEVIIPEGLEYLYKFLDQSIKNSNYIYMPINEKVIDSFQLLRLRVAFNIFLNKEADFMNEWGNNIFFGKNNFTFNQLIDKHYIIQSDYSKLNREIPKELSDELNKFKLEKDEDKILWLENEWISVPFISKYINENFGDTRIFIDRNTQNKIIIGRKKEKVRNINCSILENNEYESLFWELLEGYNLERIAIECSACYNDNGIKELLYSDIVVKHGVNNLLFDLLSSYKPCIISPFSKCCNEEIRNMGYDFVKVMDYVKKEHYFNELVSWVSENSMFNINYENKKILVNDAYEKFISDYLRTLKRRDEIQKKCNDNLEFKEVNGLEGEVAIE